MPGVFPAKAHGNYLKKGVGIIHISSFAGGSATRRGCWTRKWGKGLTGSEEGPGAKRKRMRGAGEHAGE